MKCSSKWQNEYTHTIMKCGVTIVYVLIAVHDLIRNFIYHNSHVIKMNTITQCVQLKIIVAEMNN